MHTKDHDHHENPRPRFPQRAVITAGMPYGNKGLHFGHVGGVFVPADFFARFLRDRLGAENVLFVSGTDCYGSPIVEGHRQAVEAGSTDTIEQYVGRFHTAQKETLGSYDISLDIYDGSGIEPARSHHFSLSDTVMRRLHENGELHIRSSKQFYDTEADVYLNGRQVLGRCPVQGCKSEKAYADECDLGHQFEPEDLIAPVSTISGTRPEMREVANWYLDLPGHAADVRAYVDELEADPHVRPVVTKTISEFLVPPVIFIKKDLLDAYEGIAADLPDHTYRPVEKGKHSFEIEFPDFASRDAARLILGEAGVQFRTGKTLVPFRLTGNVEWGVPAPELPGMDEPLTIWVWPESLWAPISFTATALTASDPGRYATIDTLAWWRGGDAHVYQFIGQDNLYFYGVAQPALFAALDMGLEQTTLIANHHILFLDKKASSSGEVKPPMADELLEHYTAEQLRAHWLALGLGVKSVGFKPKPYDPTAPENMPDPALKESALLTNIFNRVARSFFYSSENYTDSRIPAGAASDDVLAEAERTILAYEDLAARFEFHSVINLMDEYLRNANKLWSSASKAARDAEDDAAMHAALRDLFHELRVATVLMHPVAPRGTEKIAAALRFDERFFSWDHIFRDADDLLAQFDEAPGAHEVDVLPPRTDFFEQHPSQI